jgi:hypothetical protein
MTYIYPEASKKLFPRMYDGSMGRPAIYKQWMGLDPNAALPFGRPNGADNFSFFLNYQVNWMYWRYFMWNFSGRQNGEQGYYTWDKSDGNWLSGIPFIDEARLGSQSNLTDAMKNVRMTGMVEAMKKFEDFLMFLPLADDDKTMFAAEKRPGLWDNIRKKKEKMGKNYRPAKRGDKDRPDLDQWKKLTK